MMKVTVFKQKPYSEEYTNPLGVKTFRTMEYPPNHVDVEQVLNIIRQEKLKPGIDTIRSFYDTDTQMYSELKGKLPVCLFAGIFGRFSNAAFITPSGLVTVDFDKIPVHAMSDVRNMIVQDEYTYASFLSPGGRGYNINGKTNCSTFTKHFVPNLILLTQNKMCILIRWFHLFTSFVYLCISLA